MTLCYEYEKMFPEDLRNILKEVPIVYLPVSPLEWHGEHLAFCCDSLCAGEVVKRAWRKVGGVLHPILHLGTDGTIDDNEGGKFWGMEMFAKERLPGSIFLPKEVFKSVVFHTLKFLERNGFKLAVIYTAHLAQPQVDVWNEVEDEFKNSDMKVLAFNGRKIDYPVEYCGVNSNHAGVEERIERTCIAVLDFLKLNKDDCLFTFVDDGSEDGTVKILQKFVDKNEKIKVLPLGKNQGKGAAVKEGILNAEGKYVCFIDGDMAYSFNHLNAMYKALQENDVVIGSRSLGFKNSRRIAVKRRILGGGFNYLVRLITGLPFKDTQAGLKGFRLDKAKNIFPKIHDSRFWFDVEVLFIAKKYGYRIGEIPAIVAQQHTEKNTRVRLFSDTLKMFLGLFKIHIYNIRGDYNQ